MKIKMFVAVVATLINVNTVRGGGTDVGNGGGSDHEGNCCESISHAKAAYGVQETIDKVLKFLPLQSDERLVLTGTEPQSNMPCHLEMTTYDIRYATGYNREPETRRAFDLSMRPDGYEMLAGMKLERAARRVLLRDENHDSYSATDSFQRAQYSRVSAYNPEKNTLVLSSHSFDFGSENQYSVHSTEVTFEKKSAKLMSITLATKWYDQDQNGKYDSPDLVCVFPITK